MDTDDGLLFCFGGSARSLQAHPKLFIKGVCLRDVFAWNPFFVAAGCKMRPRGLQVCTELVLSGSRVCFLNCFGRLLGRLLGF